MHITVVEFCNKILCVSALFLFSGDENLRLDASILLCLMLFSEFVLVGTDVQLSVVNTIAAKINLPFNCRTHWKTSQYEVLSYAGNLYQNPIKQDKIKYGFIFFRCLA